MGARNRFIIDDIRGVDLTSHPACVPKNRASYMKNFIIKDGINRKRQGFYQLYRFLDGEDKPQTINGIHIYYNKNGEEELLIHAGSGFYRENGEPIPSEVGISDAPSSFLNVNGNGYIIGCSALCVYNGEKITVPSCYVPTVYRGYDSIMKLDEDNEPPNLLTDKRRAVYSGKPYEGNKRAVFTFPKEINWNKEVTVSVQISPGHNKMQIMKGDDFDNDADPQISFPITAVFPVEIGEKGETVIECPSFEWNGEQLYIFDENEIPTGRFPTVSIMWEGRAFTFNFDTSPAIDGEFNIIVEYCGGEDSTEKKINSCTMGEVVQDNRGGTRIALAGSGEHPDALYYSDSFELMGASYFPSVCSVRVGESDKITSIVKLSDTYLGVFKRDRFYRYAIYHYPGAKEPTERYYINGYEGRDRHGCINNFSQGRQGGDILVFDGEGVYGIEEISAETDKTFLSLRSLNVEKGIRSHSVEEKRRARACMHDGRYMLFIGGKIYIADTRYTFSEGGSHQYEWWLWTGPDATCVISHNGRLLIGDDRGGVYTLGKDYRDISIIKNPRDGDIIYLPEDGVFVISRDIDIPEDAHMTLYGVCTLMSTAEYEITEHEGDRVCIAPTVGNRRVKNGAKILAETEVKGDFDCYIGILYDDGEYGRFTVVDGTGEPIPKSELGNIGNIYIYESKETEFELRQVEGGYATYLDNDRIYWKNTYTPRDISIIKWTPVEAEYISPMLDLDHSDRTKTLYRLGISNETVSSRHIRFGYETRKRAMDNIGGTEGFDFHLFDFDSLSFDIPFAKTLEKRVYERNFNYIILRVSSSGNEDCAIRQLYGVYTLNNNIQGVR
ncbi:MAG: hypothetical protein IJX51_03395 [Clostridia bacterium]|nr:hypothetical protein [Clostridia bacterium]